MNKELEMLINTYKKLKTFQFVMSENMVGLTKGNYDEKEFIKKTYEYLDKYHIEADTIIEIELFIGELENSNPSEALEYLEKLGTHRIEYRESFELGYTKTIPFKSTMEYKAIYQALIKVQDLEKRLKDLNTRYMDYVDKSQETIGELEDNLIKEEQENIKLKRVLDIILEKTVNILLLELAENVDEYNERIVPNGQLTQEEFELLKEVFVRG